MRDNFNRILQVRDWVYYGVRHSTVIDYSIGYVTQVEEKWIKVRVVKKGWRDSKWYDTGRYAIIHNEVLKICEDDLPDELIFEKYKIMMLTTGIELTKGIIQREKI